MSSKIENLHEHLFTLRVWQDNNLYLKCSKCGYVYACNHEWRYEIFNSKTIIFRCSKCGMDAMYFKCKTCNDYTPHWFVKIKGTWKSNGKITGELESYKCLKCGNVKTIRRGRGEWSQRVLSA
jgi:uncharacterized Zn finger protein